jgi:hypothetical protein
MVTRTALALIIWAGASVPAFAVSGADFYKDCAENDPKTTTAAALSCLVYLRGFVDGIQVGDLAVAEGGARFCPPAGGLSNTQARLVVQKYMREHPELLGKEAAFSITGALYETFTCAPGQTP